MELKRLNDGWGPEPNAPEPVVERDGADLLLTFFVNPWIYDGFMEGDQAVLRFTGCERHRLGPPDDEGWGGQGHWLHEATAHSGAHHFYELADSAPLSQSPDDWAIDASLPPAGRHFALSFRDETFECRAQEWSIEFIRSSG